ncbi:MAG: 1-acyl-sn-glycerol-3-phosphate acyltransferase [Ignavibacteria bacterium]|nr:1-acyl-sn-glycerol-3-phosphate acyltransferase [Ignavibacteria bacterium]MBP7093832.1 1-acyl-sn-glycerol-3-phosphate acyltransferase [Candidatus Kapabacteria bacterium]MBK6420508.1 1-acyl-sn-glycerol-3-phosphate acyltransferase [Ignavibacteria bacterium]MBK6761536.1 1-acyl-sn-glycerol-3-phosphate acyltransferase [Ignavibacteria bacterium]MBK7186222.1 1-acyl-sn-glycerol-3-phosphate acyltransferase [Ignavibacteria bacterium]
MRTWLILAVIFVVTALYAVVAMMHMILFRNEEVFFAYSRSWSKLLLWFSNVHVTMEGASALRPGERHIYVSNHASLFDIPVILANVPDNVRIMYKRELRKIPIFGWCLRFSPYIAIDRERSREASDVLDSVVETLSTGSSVLVFPEGTRSEDGNVGVFRRGAFALAVRSGRTIVPLSLTGTAGILPKKTRHIQGGNVTLRIDAPIAVPQPATREIEKGLMAQVRQIIANNVDSQV